MKKHIEKIIIVIILLFVLVAGGCIWYISDYYRSEVNVQDYMMVDASVQVQEIENGLYLDGEGTEDALIFYPGAKVEYTAYLPLFYQLAENGVDCFLLKMPGNLAILGQDRADTVIEDYAYENWYLSGHSLGGAMAASYASENIEGLDGLVLLAAYPTKSLQSDAFSVISIYGSEDTVLNMEKLESGRSYMPENYQEICIEGGNHAWFGNYGEQDGDGEASVTREEQQAQTVQAITTMILGESEE